MNNNSGGGQLWSLESAPAVTTELSVCSSLDALGLGPLICSAWAAWRLERRCCPGPSQPLRVPGGGRILGCVPTALCSGACAVGIAIPAAQPPPWSLCRSRFRAAPRAAQPLPSWSCCLSRLRSAPESSQVRCSPLGSSALGCGALSLGRRCLLVSQGARGHPHPPGSCSNSLRAPFCSGRLVQLLLLRDGAFLPWGHSPRP